MMTPTTFLFAPANESYVVFDLLETASPALYFGDALDRYQDHVDGAKHGERIRSKSNTQLSSFRLGTKME